MKLTKENKENLKKRKYEFGDRVKIFHGDKIPTYGYVIGINSSFDDEVWVVEDDTDKTSLEQHSTIAGSRGSNWIDAVRAYHRSRSIFLEELISLAQSGNHTPDEVLYGYFFNSNIIVNEVKYMLNKKLKG